MTLYKVVDTRNGPSIAHLRLPDDAATVEPDADDSRLRTDRLLVEYIENMETRGWSPVSKNKEYKIGEVTKAENFDTDEGISSGGGLHAFNKREDAERWMKKADIR